MQGACEILGFDPLYLANEGRFVVFAPQQQAARALGLMRAHSVSTGAMQIGKAADNPGTVTLASSIATRRILDKLTGEQLPRIC